MRNALELRGEVSVAWFAYTGGCDTQSEGGGRGGGGREGVLRAVSPSTLQREEGPGARGAGTGSRRWGPPPPPSSPALGGVGILDIGCPSRGVCGHPLFNVVRILPRDLPEELINLHSLQENSRFYTFTKHKFIS